MSTITIEDRRRIHPESAEVPRDYFHLFTGVSFAGVPCAQYYADFYAWEAVLNERAATNQDGLPGINAIVELGTYKGGFSLYLAAQAHYRGLLFRTYDVIPPDRAIPGFVRLDIFAEAERVGQYLATYDPLIVLCDGGNKPRELKTFNRYLSGHSVIAVHDWMYEITPSDVPENLDMVYQDFCEEIGSVTRFFVRNDA
jgi:hypothetical protein